MLTPETLRNLCRIAIAEDIGSGDATTLSVVPADLEVAANMVAREECIVAGLPLAETLFHELDPSLCFDSLVEDGTKCAPGQVLAIISGNARSILTGERIALNFVQRYSGIATQTGKYVAALGDSPTVVLDTRKTTPGLRALEKYAVVMGGGRNHRFGLYDRVMIKDNHRELARLSGPDSIPRAVAACREKYPDLEIEVEADTLDEVRAAVDAGADYVLLDNMSNETMLEAVKINAGRSRLEASGNITLERIPSLANLGLDFISVGALTHSVPAIDIALDINLED